MPGNCGLIGTGIPGLVESSLGYVEGIANQQITATNAALEQMASAIAGLNLIETPDAPDVGIVPTITQPPQAGYLGVVPDPVFPPAPGAPPATSPITTNFPTAPANTAQRPTIITPTAPAAFSGTAPAEPTLGAVAIPVKPVLDTSIPVPALLGITIPQAPSTIYPDFDAVLAPHGLRAPDAIFNYVEDFYDSALLQTLIAKLIGDIVNGTTGLHPAAEAAIWARGVEREAETTKQAKDDALREGAARGFSYPTGATAARLESIEQAGMSKRVELSREIMVKQAELAQNNMQFAITQGIDLEGKLMQFTSQYAQRAFEAAKTAFSAQFDAFNAAVALYNAEVNTYQVESVVYKARIEGESLKLEAFRQEIEAQKLIGEINKDSIAIYTAQFQALQIQADLYKTTMQAAQIAMDIEKAKIDAYKSQVDAFQSLVMANKAEFDAYASQVQAEMSKAEIYRTDIAAYQSTIQAYAAQVTAESSRVDAEARVQELTQKNYALQLDGYKSAVSAEAERMRAYATQVTARADVYRAEVQGYSAEVQAQVSKYQSETAQRIAAFEASVRGVQIELDASIRATQMAVSAIDGAAKNSAAIAASAINAVNVSAGISDTVSNSTSCGTTYSY